MGPEGPTIHSVQTPLRTDRPGRFTDLKNRDRVPFEVYLPYGWETRFDEYGEITTVQKFHYNGLALLGPFEKA